MGMPLELTNATEETNVPVAEVKAMGQPLMSTVVLDLLKSSRKLF
jgi:hypothetical protein